MKVLLFNGSANQHGCTYTALTEVASVLNQEGIDTEIIQVMILYVLFQQMSVQRILLEYVFAEFVIVVLQLGVHQFHFIVFFTAILESHEAHYKCQEQGDD